MEQIIRRERDHQGKKQEGERKILGKNLLWPQIDISNWPPNFIIQSILNYIGYVVFVLVFVYKVIVVFKHITQDHKADMV